MAEVLQAGQVAVATPAVPVAEAAVAAVAVAVARTQAPEVFTIDRAAALG